MAITLQIAQKTKMLFVSKTIIKFSKDITYILDRYKNSSIQLHCLCLSS